MVAIFTGVGTGYERGSGSVLGSAGLLGGSSLGRGGEQLFLNAATGNLLISQSDEFLVGLGPDVSIGRTYNSLGDLSDENGDNWRQGTQRRIVNLTGTLGSAGSTVQRVGADGAAITYSWDATKSAYVATDGSGAYDTLTSSGGVWTWRDGDSQVTETYALEFGSSTSWRITGQTDSDGNALTFSYLASSNKLDKVTTADGSYVQYSWSGNNITLITTGYTDLATSTAKTLTRTRYSYDAQNRLSTVTVDLSPEDSNIADGKIYTTTYTYDGTSTRVASISQSDGSRIDVTYDGSNRVATIAQTAVTGVTRTSILTYGAGYTTVTDPLGQIVRLDYNTDGSLAKITMPPATTGAAPQITQFAYDTSGNVTSVTDALNNATTYSNFVNGLGTNITDRLGNVTTRTFGSKNELLTETTTSSDAGASAAAHTTRYVYDGENHLRYVISAEGSVTEYRYTAAGQLDQTIAYPEHVYSATGSTVTIASASFEAPEEGSSYIYNPTTISGMTFSGYSGITGNSSSFYFVNAPDGDQVAFVQSFSGTAGSIAQTVSGLVAGTSYTLKFFIAKPQPIGGTEGGIPVAVSFNGTALGTFTPASTAFQEISVSFTATGSSGTLTFAGVVTPGSQVWTAIDNVRVIGPSASGPNEADLNAWRDAITDKSSAQITVNAYDARSNLISTASHSLASTSGAAITTDGTTLTAFTYDQAGNLRARNVQGRNTETFVYDGMGRIVSAVDVNGGTTAYVFDDANTKTIVTFASGLVQTSTYNKAGELVSFAEAGATTSLAAVTGTATYGYDQLGRLRWEVDASGKKTYHLYDNVSRKVADVSGAGEMVEYRYDADNRLTATIHYSTALTSAQLASLDDQNVAVTIASASFEAPEEGSSYIYNPTTISGMTFSGYSGITGNSSSFYFVNAPDGDQVAFVQSFSGTAGSIAQTVSGLVAGTSYTLKFFIAKPQPIGGTEGGIPVAVSFNGTALGTFTPASTAFQEISVSFTATGSSGTLTFAGVVTPGQVWTAIDNVRIIGSSVGTPNVDIASIRPAGTSSDLWSWNVYDKEDRLLQAIDGLGWTSTFEYDGAGRLIKSTRYANNVATSLVTGFKTTLPTAVTLPPADAAHDAVARTFYDKDGRLVGTLDGEGFVTKAIYDKAGQKVEEIAYANTSTTTYRATGTFDQIFSTVTLDNVNDRHTRYVYNGQGELRFVVDSKYQVGETQFDNSGQATSTIRYANALSSSTTDFTYDNVKALVAAGGFASPTADRRSWAVYDSAGRIAYAIDGEGGVTAFAYNMSGQVTKSVQYATVRSTISLPDKATMDTWAAANASGVNDRINRSFYDGAGVLRYVVDSEGYVARRTEDAEGRLTFVERFANPATTTDSTTINTLHSWVIASAGVSANTATSYDVLGRVSTVTDGEGNVTRSLYNTNGTLQSQTVADSTSDASTTYFVTDGAGRVTEQHRAYGTSAVSITRYTYDGLGNVLTITDPDNHVTTQTFDRLGQMLTRTNALSGVTSFVTNAFGEVVQTTDPNGNVSFNYYDALGRLTKSADALKFVTEISYTAFGEVASVTRRYNAATNTPSITVQPTVTPDAAHDATTSFLYDRLGRLTKTTDAQGFFEQYTLNAFGNRTSVLNKLGGTITNAYDRRGLLVSEILPMASVNSAGTQVAATVTNKFVYDARGNRTQMIEAFGLAEARTTNYVYDKIDRLITKTGNAVATVAFNDFTSTNAVTVTTASGVVPTEAYVYDRRGNLIQTTDANGAKTLAYHDKLNRQVAVVNMLGTLKTCTYDAAGNCLTERVYGDFITVPATPGGTPPSPVNASNYRETLYTYDVLDRLSTTSVASVLVGTWNGSTGVTTATQTISSTLTYDANGNVVKTTDANGNSTFAYFDKLGRKTVQVDALNFVTKWTYDGEGNVLSETRYATALAAAPTVGVVPTMPATNASDRITNFTYDKTGHRLTETRTGVAAWTVNSSNGALTAAGTSSVVTYTYNGLGQVLTKAEAVGDTVTYTYDSTGRLTKEKRATYADQTAANVTPEVIYSYNGLNNLSRTQQGEKTAIEANVAVGRITTYAYGAGGRLASLTDAAGAVHSYAYDAAGNLVQDSYTRAKSDATTVNEAILYRRDLLGRVTAQAIATNSAGTWTRGDSQNSGYNAYGDLATRGVNGLTQESFTYNNRGLVEKTNSGDGVWRFFVYDKAGNQILGIESEGNDYSATALSTVLTVLGSAAGATFVDGVNTNISITDKRNQVTQVRMPQRELTATGGKVSVNSSQTYNAFGEVATQTDANGNVTTLTYNTMGRLTQKVMPQVSITSAAGVVSNVNPTENYKYDLAGRLVARQDANGNIISQTLLAGTGYGPSTGSGQAGDALVTAEFHPDTGIAKTFYDVFGDARTLRNELNVDETRTYDGMGRVLTVTHRGILINNTTNYQLVDTYTTDLLGQRLTHWNSALGSSIKETTDYDLQGRVVSSKDFAADTTTTSYAWSATIATALGVSGGWVKTTVQWAGTAYSKTATETTDVHGLTTTETDLGGHTTTNSYDLAGRLTNTSGGGTSLAYTYFNTGLVATIVDTAGTGMNTITSTFGYDAAGNRTAEKYAGTVYKSSVSPEDWSLLIATTQTLQDATIAYDALGRLTAFSSTSTKGAVTINQYYDAAGNIRHTASTYPNLLGSGSFSSDKWFTYDAMNRMIIADGTLSGSTIVRGATGSDVAYDLAGQRIWQTRDAVLTGYSFQWVWYPGHGPGWPSGGFPEPMDPGVNGDFQDAPVPYSGERREIYAYDNEGNLTSTSFAETGYVDNGDGTASSNGTLGAATVRAVTTRDNQGRVSSYVEKDSAGNILQSRYSITYNARGQVTYEETSQKKTDGHIYLNKTTNSYDNQGNQTSIVSDNYKDGSDSNALDTSMTQTYAWYDDGTMATQTYDYDTGGSNTLYTSTYTYDGLGRLQRTSIQDGRPRYIHFALASDGQILSRVMNQALTDDTQDYHVFVSGRQVGEYSDNVSNDPTNLGYDSSIAFHQSIAGTGDFRNGGTVGGMGAEMGSSTYDPVNPVTGGTGIATSSQYTVRSGDTLQGIAASLWGDSSLWYLIADANGLSADAMLTAGQALKVPFKGPSSANNASMFKPYDAAHATGDLAPTSPKPPKKNKCGVFGQVLLAVIQIAVTVVLTAVLTPVLGPFAPVVAATAGDIVKQGVGVITGIQDKFSWKEVGITALTAALSGPGTGNPFIDAIHGAIVNAEVQGIAVATGLQKKFDWAGVAAAGLSAGISSAVGNSLARPLDAQGNPIGKATTWNVSNGIGNIAARSAAGLIANAATRSVIKGSDFGDNILAGLPDVIAQTLGGIVENGITGRRVFDGQEARKQDNAVSTGGTMAAAGATGQTAQPNADTIVVNQKALQAFTNSLFADGTAEGGTAAQSPSDENFGDQYLSSDISPEHKKLVQQLDLVRQGLIGPDFQRQFPLIPNLYANGKTLEGTILVRFSDLTAVGDRPRVLDELRYINQRTKDGYRINLAFKEASFFDGVAYDLGIGRKSVVDVQFINNFMGNKLGVESPSSGILTLTPKPERAVTIHEFIHRLGFTHSIHPGDIMFKFAPSDLSSYRLPDWQIRRIVQAYPQAH